MQIDEKVRNRSEFNTSRDFKGQNLGGASAHCRQQQEVSMLTSLVQQGVFVQACLDPISNYNIAPLGSEMTELVKQDAAGEV